VTIDTVVEDLQAVGTLRPNEAVTVVPEIAGRVERIGFREGQAVKAGDVLVELDASILEAERAKARSDLTLTRANHERAITLAGQGMGTMRARDEALGAFQAAEANLALAEARLQKATLRAPLSGIVGLRSVSVGAYVAPGERIVELADIDPIKLDFRVPELALSSGAKTRCWCPNPRSSSGKTNNSSTASSTAAPCAPRWCSASAVPATSRSAAASRATPW